MAVSSGPSRTKTKSRSTTRLYSNKQALRKLKLVAVAYSHVEREWFATEDAYKAEREVEDRAVEVVRELEKLGLKALPLPADRYFLTNLLVDQPDLVLNLVDTVHGRDALQTSVPAALELASLRYTGAGMRGMVIGNDRNLFKQLLDANDIPTPEFQFISRRGVKINENLGLPLIVKLNEGGGSVGIDNKAVKERFQDAEDQVNELISTYHLPVIIERFITGPEITAAVFDDGKRKHVFLAQKKFHRKTDGKHYFTSLESYGEAQSYKYKAVEPEMANRIEPMVRKAFNVLSNRDYAKFDIRIDPDTATPYFTDCNPNTAFGPNPGLPFTEVLAMHGKRFEQVLNSLMSKHAKEII
jgi:D-alanine-D-alanine ligase